MKHLRGEGWLSLVSSGPWWTLTQVAPGGISPEPCQVHRPVQQLEFRKGMHTALCDLVLYFTLSISPGTTCRGRNWVNWTYWARDQLKELTSLPPLPQQPLCSLPVLLNAHAELTTSATCHQCPLAVGQQIRQNLLPINSSILQSLCHYMSWLSASLPVMQNGQLLTGRDSWKLPEPLLLTYTSIHLPKSPKRGVRAFLLLWWKLVLSGISGSSSTLPHTQVLSFGPTQC